MNRYQTKDQSSFIDTETNHEYMIWDSTNKTFVSMAEDVQSGLNILMAIRLRRGSKAPITRLEFNGLKAAFTELNQSDSSNNLVKDMLKLCDLITSHQDEIKFGI